MKQSEQPSKDLIESFLPKIFSNEAKGILADLATLPALFLDFMGFTEAQTNQAIGHIVGIFEECYRAGHLKVAVSHEDGRLYGYAMIFVHPDPSVSRYCHKIYVFEQYRGHGIGTQLLNGLLTDSAATNLLCSTDLITFYERAGLEQKGDFVPPTAQQGFEFSRGLYLDLTVMGRAGSGTSTPVFFLNDDDIKQLLAIGAT